MNVDMDTDDWLGCPTPLEMYQHQCSILVDELVETERMLRRARANIAGLVQMNDLLMTGKDQAETALKGALSQVATLNLEKGPPVKRVGDNHGAERPPSQGKPAIAGRAAGTQGATALTYAWHARKAIMALSPSSVMRTIRCACAGSSWARRAA